MMENWNKGKKNWDIQFNIKQKLLENKYKFKILLKLGKVMLRTKNKIVK